MTKPVAFEAGSPLHAVVGNTNTNRTSVCLVWQ